MLNPKLVPSHVRNAIAERLDLTDTVALDKAIAEMSVEEAMNHFLCWEGIIGWTESILRAVNGLNNAKKD